MVRPPGKRWRCSCLWSALAAVLALTLVGLSLLGGGLLPSPAAAAQRPAQADPVVQLALGLGSTICADRWQALERYLRSSGDRLTPLRRRLSTLGPPMRARLGLVASYLEEDTRARARVQGWEGEFAQIAGIQDGARQSSELQGMHQRLVGIIYNPKESFGARLDAASFMAVLVTEFAPPLMASWGQDFPGLLRSKDPRVRTVGALLYARGMLSNSQAPQKGAVIPALIAGLSGESFEERLRSQRGLLFLSSLGAERSCVDPTDPRPQRAEGIRQWQAWWEANKGKLAREKVPQHY
jgi:hypothetical protein